MPLDLNCDLGEGEPVAKTRALMRFIDSANVACGGHAGDVGTMQICAQLAKRCRVKLGAHPGPWSRGDRGRAAAGIGATELELLLLQQVGVLSRVAQQEGMRLHHIKLHGALYHACEGQEAFARSYLAAVRRWWPHLILFVQAGGRVARLAGRFKIRVWEEVFADRAYTANGALVPRTDPRALLTRLESVGARATLLRDHGQIETVSGHCLRLPARTVCVHADTPHAARLAEAVARILRGSSG